MRIFKNIIVHIICDVIHRFQVDGLTKVDEEGYTYEHYYGNLIVASNKCSNDFDLLTLVCWVGFGLKPILLMTKPQKHWLCINQIKPNTFMALENDKTSYESWHPSVNKIRPIFYTNSNQKIIWKSNVALKKRFGESYQFSSEIKSFEFRKNTWIFMSIFF